jgi:hypothetical protein
VILTAARRQLQLDPWLEWLDEQLRWRSVAAPVRAPRLGGIAWG